MISTTPKRSILPQQKISAKEKNDQWHKDCADAFINMSRFNRTGSREDIRKLYDYYTGYLHDEDYSYVLSPYGKSRKQGFPAKMRNYPIIKPVVDLLLGEKHKRPFNYSVISINADSVTTRETEIQNQLNTIAQRKFSQALASITGGQLGEEQQQIPEIMQPLSKSYELLQQNYRDSKAIIGQKALNYLQADLDLKHEFDKGFFDFLVTGEVYSHKAVYKNSIVYESLNPLHVDYDMDQNEEFVENADWGIIYQELFPSAVLDRFSDQLTPEEVSRLENPRETNLDTTSLYASPQNQHYYDDDRNRRVSVVTVYWKSFAKRGFRLYYSEETQALEEEVVLEGYKGPDADMVTWEWVPQVHRTVVIDQDVYLLMGPVENVRASPDDPGQSKLPINGRRFVLRNTENTSIVKLGVPYQINYNIYKYRLEMAIAKSKDVIGLLDIDMIPKKWSMDKFMHYLDATGIGWVSYNNENLKLSATHQQVMDLSIKTIGSYIELLESILMEWERLSGVSQQRQGQIGPYESVQGSQQAIIQSSHITEDYFKKYEKFEEKELQGLLDLSKLAWLRGKKGSYVMPDGTIDYLTVDPVEYALSDLGVFVKNSSQERERLEFAKSLTQPMIQNGYKASDVLSILESDNFSEIKQKIKVAEKNAERLAMAQQQAEQEASVQAQAKDHQQELEKIQAEIGFEYDKIEADILMKRMDIEAKMGDDKFTPEERQKILAEVDSIRESIRASKEKTTIDKQKLKDDKEIALKKIAADRAKAAAQKRASNNSSK